MEQSEEKGVWMNEEDADTIDLIAGGAASVSLTGTTERVSIYITPKYPEPYCITAFTLTREVAEQLLHGLNTYLEIAREREHNRKA